jgi:DNA-binding Lrp family transcriptional regulator
MPGAIVLINTDIGKEAIVMEGLRSMAEVENAQVVYGVYDIVVKVEAADMDSLDDVISKMIRNLAGVRSTLTLVVNRDYRRV